MDEEEGDDGGLSSTSSFGAAAGGEVADDLVDRVDDLLGYIAIYYTAFCFVFLLQRVREHSLGVRDFEILMRFKLI